MKVKRSLMVSCVAMALAVVAGVSGAAAQTSDNGAIRIEGAWVRETPIGGNSGGGYMWIVNSGSEPDRLVGAESSAAKSVQLKQVSYVGDVMQTRDLENGIEIPANGEIRLRWDSSYLLFVDLKEPFAPRQTVEASLNFEKAGTVKVQFGVRPRVDW